MSASPEQRLLSLVGAVASAGVLLLVAFTGGSVSTSAAVRGDGGATVRLSTGFSVEQWTRQVRQALMTMMRRLEARLTLLMEGGATKVPIDTGLLRSSFVVIPAPDYSYLDLVWPVEYAQYLWAMDPGATGKQGRTPGTLVNWSVWAANEAMSILGEELQTALTEAGFDAHVEVT